MNYSYHLPLSTAIFGIAHPTKRLKGKCVNLTACTGLRACICQTSQKMPSACEHMIENNVPSTKSNQEIKDASNQCSMILCACKQCLCTHAD